jgi:hypothetical protein
MYTVEESGVVPFSIGTQMFPVEDPEAPAMRNMAMFRQFFSMNSGPP